MLRGIRVSFHRALGLVNISTRFRHFKKLCHSRYISRLHMSTYILAKSSFLRIWKVFAIQTLLLFLIDRNIFFFHSMINHVDCPADKAESNRYEETWIFSHLTKEKLHIEVCWCIGNERNAATYFEYSWNGYKINNLDILDGYEFQKFEDW